MTEREERVTRMARRKRRKEKAEEEEEEEEGGGRSSLGMEDLPLEADLASRMGQSSRGREVTLNGRRVEWWPRRNERK